MTKTLKFCSCFLQLQAECPKGENWHCTCSVYRWFLVNKVPTFSISVDCSNLQLTKLPSRLPQDATSLNVSYNNVSLIVMHQGSHKVKESGKVRELILSQGKSWNIYIYHCKNFLPEKKICIFRGVICYLE